MPAPSLGPPALPVDSSQVHSAPPISVEIKQPGSRPGKAKFVALGLLSLALLGGGAAYGVSAGKVTTDDAQVEGHIQSVSPRVSGMIVKQLVSDNQAVKQGDVLVELDPAEFEAHAQATQADVQAAEASLAAAQAALAITRSNTSAQLEQANGGLTQATSGLAVSRAHSGQAKADLAAARARWRLAAAEFKRTSQLVAGKSWSTARLETARAALDEASANVSQADARLRADQAQIAAEQGGIQAAHGRLLAAESAPEQIASANAAVSLAAAHLEQARAADRLAALKLSYTLIRAPSAGVIARRAAEVGQMVSPERALFALVPLNDVWVVANFKEEQLQDIQLGARAQVELDAFDSTPLTAVVESISAGTGARFALLPPDNATGNFTKVAQRVPVLLRLVGHQPSALRPGLSAKVTVYAPVRK